MAALMSRSGPWPVVIALFLQAQAWWPWVLEAFGVISL
jgi:hypothetical protein